MSDEEVWDPQVLDSSFTDDETSAMSHESLDDFEMAIDDPVFEGTAQTPYLNVSDGFGLGDFQGRPVTPINMSQDDESAALSCPISPDIWDDNEESVTSSALREFNDGTPNSYEAVLKKLATSMKKSEESRNKIMLQKQNVFCDESIIESRSRVRDFIRAHESEFSGLTQHVIEF